MYKMFFLLLSIMFLFTGCFSEQEEKNLSERIADKGLESERQEREETTQTQEYSEPSSEKSLDFEIDLPGGWERYTIYEFSEEVQPYVASGSEAQTVETIFSDGTPENFIILSKETEEDLPWLDDMSEYHDGFQDQLDVVDQELAATVPQEHLDQMYRNETLTGRYFDKEKIYKTVLDITELDEYSNPMILYGGLQGNRAWSFNSYSELSENQLDQMIKSFRVLD